MRRQIFLTLIVATMIAALFLVAVPVAARAIVIEAQGVVQECDPLKPGAFWYTGETIHLRGWESVCYYSGQYLTGKNTIIINAEINPQMISQVHGTFRLEADEGGIWEGTYTGVHNLIDDVISIRAVGHGSEAYEGLQIRLIREDLDLFATILAPHGE